MSSKKKNKTSVEILDRLKSLKKLGLLKDYKAASLTKSQKDKISKEFKKYHTVANADISEYVKYDLSRLTESDVKKIKETGYTVINNKLYIPKDGYENATVRTQWFKNKSGRWEKRIEIIRRAVKGDNGKWRKEEIEFIGKPLESMNWRDRLYHEWEMGRFKEGEYFGVRVFDNGIMTREIYTDINTLFRYVEKIKWKDNDIEKMLNNLHVVKLKVNDYRDLGLGEKTRKQDNHQKYIRKKNSKKTKTKELLGKVKRH